jgi:alpha-amylase/alpha-mannosidase (GH57 family)
MARKKRKRWGNTGDDAFWSILRGKWLRRNGRTYWMDDKTGMNSFGIGDEWMNSFGIWMVG